jgi:hypothetical protein
MSKIPGLGTSRRCQDADVIGGCPMFDKGLVSKYPILGPKTSSQIHLDLVILRLDHGMDLLANYVA